MAPRRGEVWLVELSPTQGREQSGGRPALVVSDDLFNRGRSGLVIVVPVTSRARQIPSHIPIAAGDGGLHAPSFAMCEQIRSVSLHRLVDGPFGMVSREVLRLVENRLRLLLRL